MAGAWAESGSLPSIYFEVFEWTEARTLPPKYKLRVSKPPALQPIRYTPHFPFSRLALYSPLPRELLVRTPHSTPSTSTPAYTRIHALRSLSGLRFSHCWAPSRPPRSSPRPRWLRSTWCPWKRLLPPRPPPPSPQAPGLTRSPGHEVRGSLPSAPLEVTLARLRPGRRHPTGHDRPLRSPDWAGRPPRHSAPRALAGPNAWGSALPRPAASDPSPEENKRVRARGPLGLALPGPLPAGTPTKPEPLPRAPGLAYPSVPARFLPEG